MSVPGGMPRSLGIPRCHESASLQEGNGDGGPFPGPEELIDFLKTKDTEVAQFLAASSKDGGRLRYITKMSLGAEGGISCSIKPVFVPPTHQIYNMTGTELYTSFAMERQQNALVMRGAQGAGKQCTAGILNDVLKITQRWG